MQEKGLDFPWQGCGTQPRLLSVGHDKERCSEAFAGRYSPKALLLSCGSVLTYPSLYLGTVALGTLLRLQLQWIRKAR